MKHKKLLIAGLILLSSTGCTGMNNTEQGALTGGALGGLFGLLVGGRHPLAAAAIGTGVGAVAGGAIGNSEDRREDRARANAIAAANAQSARQMSLGDVVQMSQQRAPDQIIINQIRTSGSVFDMSANDILYLRQNSVSDVVISEMQARRGARAVIVQPRPYYVVDPYPPPVGVGVVIAR